LTTDTKRKIVSVSTKEIMMSAYEEDDGFQPIAPIQPVNRIYALRALRVRQVRPYLGNRRPHLTPMGSDKPEESDLPEEPAVILDISPQAREQAHHLMEEASDDPL
jgi:hypothetical protein